MDCKMDKSIVQKSDAERLRKNIIEQYVRYRKSRGLTQKDIADSMGVKRPNITRFESGNYNPSLDMLIRMADIMGMDLEITLKKR